MSTVYDALITLIGIPPAGTEPLVYLFAVIFVLFFLAQLFAVLFKLVGGR